MRKSIPIVLLLAAGVLQACGPAPTAEQQQARQHEIACVSGTLAGAIIGGAIGNQFGGGSGKDILTTAGAGAGAVAGSRYSC